MKSCWWCVVSNLEPALMAAQTEFQPKLTASISRSATASRGWLHARGGKHSEQIPVLHPCVPSAACGWATLSTTCCCRRQNCCCCCCCCCCCQGMMTALKDSCRSN